tara:strand:+ start:18479 stop:19615 length:1137 start_codon:yes stop_codon:yes gene_type:complete
MPNQFQPFNLNKDIVSTKTLLHEAIPLTGTIYKFATGSYIEENIKNFSHGQFQAVYDYPYLSSSANHLFDIAVGYDEESSFSSSAAVQNAKKINMYNMMAQTLMGYESSQADGIHKFEPDIQKDITAKRPMKEVFFINFSRLLTKDQIKKGTFSITIATGSFQDAYNAGATVTITDSSASDNGGTVTHLGGDMGLLRVEDGPLATLMKERDGITGGRCGNIFYQAGVVVLSSSIFQYASQSAGNSTPRGTECFSDQVGDLGANQKYVQGCFTGSAITASCNALRHRICSISFNNTTEINSNIYFCRVPWNRYNYSTNPTYLSGAQIRVKNIASDSPIAYITTIGMYNTAGELLATAKLSEPLRKDPTNELTLRVRLDY